MKRFLTSLLLPGLIGCTEAQAAPPKGPVVLELFTSEGCSSCPPAEALLAEVGALPNVIALEMHVDYWDDLGWKDPFSKEQFSARQGVYSASLDRIGVYTPQIVANGIAEGVGSNRSRVADLIATVPPATAPVTLAARREGGSAVVSATAPGAPAGAELLVVLAESGLETQVLRGENTGRHLVHTGVVRILERVPASGEVKLPLDGTKGGQLAVVALLQDRKTRHILGAAKLPL